MGFLKSFGRKFVQSADRHGRRQAQRQLLSMSDNQLNDFGISRLKLLEGVSAWPWAVEAEDGKSSEIKVADLESAPVLINVVEEQIDVQQDQRQVA